MPRIDKYGPYDRPVPEPHFIPGYTGHCPDLFDQVGITYPWATHAVLEDKPELANRLSSIKPPTRRFLQPGTRRKGDKYCSEMDGKRGQRNRSLPQPVIGLDISLGCVGPAPQNRETTNIGKTFQKATADFECQQEKSIPIYVCCCSSEVSNSMHV
ncbi:UPF0605 protein GA14893-like [Stegodyphus dumicola]|uniref:UPF0605 protein GA14893-like n=1 Tax=Stegodyphus dumicola TaxID=202533 RepID=UPI0015A7ED6B|nr:UPF0605 protein GA14893-like [Stegodyphus dumicola]